MEAECHRFCAFRTEANADVLSVDMSLLVNCSNASKYVV